MKKNELMNKTLIKNATIVNEGKIVISDILISKERIEKVDAKFNLPRFDKPK